MGDYNNLQIIGDAVYRSHATEMCMANSSFHTTFQIPSGNEGWWKVVRTTGKKRGVFQQELGVTGKLSEWRNVEKLF